MAAVILDVEGAEGAFNHALMDPSEVQRRTLVMVVRRFLANHHLAELRCDEDTRGKARRERVITDVRRHHREAWPAATLRMSFVRSHNCDATQVADVVAYELRRAARSADQSASVRGIVDLLMTDSRHTVIRTASVADE